MIPLTRKLARFAGVVGAALAVACIDITVDSNAVTSLEFVPFPYPSIDAGDMLRDGNDVPVRLRANVFLANGTVDAEREVQFIVFDSAVEVTTDGYLRASALDSADVSDSARIVAVVGSLQSTVRRALVVSRPDTLLRSNAAQERDTIEYVLPTAEGTSDALTVTLRGKNHGQPIAVPGYVTRFWLRKFNGDTVASADTSQSFALIEQGRGSAIDTTDALGTASRQVRWRFRTGQPGTDSIQVLAQVRRGSRIVKPDTIVWRVLVRPKPPA